MASIYCKQNATLCTNLFHFQRTLSTVLLATKLYKQCADTCFAAAKLCNIRPVVEYNKNSGHDHGIFKIGSEMIDLDKL